MFLPILFSVPSALPPQDLEERPAGRSHDQKPGGPGAAVGQGEAGVFRLAGGMCWKLRFPDGSTLGACVRTGGGVLGGA